MKKTRKASPCADVALLAAQLAAAAIYMQPKFKETVIFRRFAESRAGKLLHAKDKAIDKALGEVHEELLRAGLVWLSDEAQKALTKDGAVVAKMALKAYMETVERSIPDGMRADILARHPQYQQARSLYESMS